MQQHATRDTSIPNSAAATSTSPKCAASQPAMKCGPASLRSHQSSAKRPACSSVSQPLAISERNRVFVIKHRVEGERHKGNLQRCDGQLSSQSGSKEQQAPSPPSPLHSTPLFFPMPLLPPPPHLLPLTSFPHTPLLLLLSLTLTQARRNMEHGAGSLERATRSGQPGAGSLERAAWSGQPGAGSLERAA
ncbi:hypothetical protein QJQ45_021060 [Haematococcus lacustris]|nr:hypothetical protein QJQ45_028282 [Haematococcus lacustris]KAJ9513927.1 hypothetical protein QJQ45_021060 [Haematococcus lacustris]